MSEEFEKIVADYQKFPTQFQSIMLATTSLEGNPHASYAPFVMDPQKNFYILISDLATHASNLKTTGKGSILLIEDETKSDNIFGRKRLNFECSITIIDRESQEWSGIADRFQERFGKIIEVLRNLKDFNIFKLTPNEGRFVTGFAKAYKISSEDLNNLVHIRG